MTARSHLAALATTVAAAASFVSACSENEPTRAHVPAATATSTAAESATVDGSVVDASAPVMTADQQPHWDGKTLEDLDARLTRDRVYGAAALSQAFFALGPPTLVFPRPIDADAGNALFMYPFRWAVVSGDKCWELEGSDSYRGKSVIVSSWTREEDNYEPCADSARGSSDGHRFQVAAVLLTDISEHPDDDDAALGREWVDWLLGPPTISEHRGRQERRVWAKAGAGRCYFVTSPPPGGDVHARWGIPRQGMPRYSECVAWSASKPDHLWEDSVVTPAMFGSLTRPDAPTRVAAGIKILEQAHEAVKDDKIDGHREISKRLAKLLGAPSVQVDGVAAWAVADDSRCVALWGLPDLGYQSRGWGSTTLIVTEVDDPDRVNDTDGPSWEREAECRGVASGDHGIAVMTRIAEFLKIAKGPPVAWMTAQLGEPGETRQQGGATTRRWSRMVDDICVEAFLVTDRSRPAEFGYEAEGPEDDSYADCRRIASSVGP